MDDRVCIGACDVGETRMPMKRMPSWRTQVPLMLIAYVFVLLMPRLCLATEQTRFSCGGAVEVMTWQVWDTSGREFLRVNLLQERLLRQHDVYALYDFQQYVHNLVSMARRCQRTDRLVELSELIQVAYDALEPVGPGLTGKRWVCRGGSTCTSNPELLGNEVMLCSVQFLGIASAVANALSVAGSLQDPRVATYLQQTIEITSEHLLRWASTPEIARLRKSTGMQSEEANSGSATSFFSDKSLWQIAVYAELAGVLSARALHPEVRVTTLDATNATRMRRHLTVLLELFSARVSFRPSTGRSPVSGDMAEIDRGFWRFFPGYSYAAYDRPEKPLECLPPASRQSGGAVKILVPIASVPQRMDIGWDFSHARRLVHALDALARNRDAVVSVFGLTDTATPDRRLGVAFTNALLGEVWNGDTKAPLFSNYWGGANGWYGAFIDARTGNCNEGVPPYGLTESFLTGGYVSWNVHNPLVGQLGARLFDMVTAPEGTDKRFIDDHYPGFGADIDQTHSALAKLMFYPSLVGISIQE
jgi:hypothetical protein